MRVTDPHGTRPADMTMHAGTPAPPEIDPLRDPERRKRAAAASARDIALGGDPDVHVLLAAYDAVAHHIATARGDWDGRLPPIRSEEWLNAPDSVKVATLLTCGLAWLVADPHRVVRGALKQVSNDIHGGDTELWRRVADDHAARADPARPGVRRVAFRCARCSRPTPTAARPGRVVLCDRHREADA